MAMGEQVLHILEDLREKEFEKFKFYLPHGGTAPHIRRGRLDGASPIQVAELLMQTYPQEALDITNQVLRKIPRLDLVQGGQLQTRRDAGNSGNDANHQKQNLVSEQQLMKLAGKMGKTWRQIGIEFLGLENHCLEQIEENNPGNTKLRAFNMLLEWRKRARQDATVIHLCSILSQDEVPLQPEALDCLRDTGRA
ncbi:arf-GAP with GTPase, ANK repeat and PH domain-containing protein 1 [Platysternon megacephalum]|uniref:Arf-GAP with GTPase, ANK repeat and PH domain-containing protein 1 n=1 Tax=Platysternon megacephalum TaxID=55544 RepID=A0A4D9DZB8_9SAUR|nr:arf-GAP with GTPase, ANK repeat and PH domain-containing protein 1 [Platysternon megacephalum]